MSTHERKEFRFQGYSLILDTVLRGGVADFWSLDVNSVGVHLCIVPTVHRQHNTFYCATLKSSEALRVEYTFSEFLCNVSHSQQCSKLFRSIFSRLIWHNCVRPAARFHLHLVHRLSLQQRGGRNRPTRPALSAPWLAPSTGTLSPSRPSSLCPTPCVLLTLIPLRTLLGLDL